MYFAPPQTQNQKHKLLLAIGRTIIQLSVAFFSNKNVNKMRIEL
ncbi:hypothetical protein JCM19274_2770 [Algibacter lectus]|uniref:Uncharacterized protein n=1 Tax=Algibacter lectus TaxID=221126 RepID=A0A090X1W0_9FLAO|nr:hypothetical protein JCM19274_2770 [Algibacter lectus]